VPRLPADSGRPDRQRNHVLTGTNSRSLLAVQYFQSGRPRIPPSIRTS